MARPMSQALRERLKRIGRMYSSPVVTKRQCRCDDESDDTNISESSRQIGDSQIPEQSGCASLETTRSSPIVVMKNDVEKDGQAENCGKNSVSVTNTAKEVDDLVPAVEKMKNGVQFICALPTERKASAEAGVEMIDETGEYEMKQSSSSNTIGKEVYSVQHSSGSPENSVSTVSTEAILGNNSLTRSDQSAVINTDSISSLEGLSTPTISSVKRTVFSPKVSSVKTLESSMVSGMSGQSGIKTSNNYSAKRPFVSPNVSTIKRPESPQVSWTKTSNISRAKRPFVSSVKASPNDSNPKRPVSPNNSCTKRQCVSPNVSGVETQKSPNINRAVPSPNVVMKSDVPSPVVGPVSLPGPSDDIDQLKKQRIELLTRLNRKEELLRKLNMVKMYRAKNDLAELQVLIDKWRTVSQDALQELVDIANDPKPSLKELIDHLHLDYKFIGFNPDDETFLPT